MLNVCRPLQLMGNRESLTEPHLSLTGSIFLIITGLLLDTDRQMHYTGRQDMQAMCHVQRCSQITDRRCQSLKNRVG